MVGLDRMAVGVDVDVAAEWADPRRVPRTNVRTADDLDPGGNQHPGEDAGRDGQRRACTRWQKVERHQKKLNGPKNTVKHIESRQNWINRRTKRIDAEVEKLTEMQENIKTRKETLRVAYEELMKLRTDLAQEGESMDKNKSHVLSLESLEEVRNLEQEELCLKRVAGASKDATTKETASWSLEADRIALEISGTRAKSKRWSRRKALKTISRCQTVAWTDWMPLCHREGASVDFASNTRMGKCC